MINLTIPKKIRTYIPQRLQIEWENLESDFKRAADTPYRQCK